MQQYMTTKTTFAIAYRRDRSGIYLTRGLIIFPVWASPELLTWHMGINGEAEMHFLVAKPAPTEFPGHIDYYSVWHIMDILHST